MGPDSRGSSPLGQRRSQAPPGLDSLRLLQVPFALMILSKQKKLSILSKALCWCGRWDLNPYVVQHTPLKRACLPIPALPHIHFVHQRCNVYIIRNPSEFVNPFFEKSFLRRLSEGAKAALHRLRLVYSSVFSLSGVSSFEPEACLATSSACISFCGTGTPSSTAFSKMESASLTI